MQNLDAFSHNNALSVCCAFSLSPLNPSDFAKDFRNFFREILPPLDERIERMAVRADGDGADVGEDEDEDEEDEDGAGATAAEVAFSCTDGDADACFAFL